MVTPAKFLAGTFVGSRSIDRLYDGESGDRYGASAIARDGRNARRINCLCIHGGLCESPGIQSPQDRIETSMHDLEISRTRHRNLWVGVGWKYLPLKDSATFRLANWAACLPAHQALKLICAVILTGDRSTDSGV